MSTTNTPEPSRREVWKMFDRIAPRYDALNRILSLRSDVAWRKRLAALLPPGDRLRMLDLATGTGDQIFQLFGAAPNVREAVGLDLSEGMLDVGRKKAKARGLEHRVQLLVGDAMTIPFPDHSFDLVTMSFGIRNVLDVLRTLKEINRVLKPGGRALILEFSTPQSRCFRRLYFFYLRHVLPKIGGWISGDPGAYRYLNVTIEGFPSGDAFCRIMSEAGFLRVAHYPLSFGIAAIYEGDK